MVTPETMPDDVINIPQIIDELQATFNDQYAGNDEAFGERGDHFEEIELWREEMANNWEQLVIHTLEVWDYAWGHSYTQPCTKRAEWLFRRNESPFKYGARECLRIVSDAKCLKPTEIEQFYLFIFSTLAQGSAIWDYGECQNECDMEHP